MRGMYKFFIVLILFSFYAFGATIKFKEEKYISALQTSVFRDGLITINNERIEIKYLKEKKSFIFNAQHIIEKNDTQEKILNYEDHLELTLFSKIIRAVYQNQPQELDAYFVITNKDKKTVLLPNEYIANVIEKIEYKKEHNQLEFLKIYFINKDWINIIENK